MAMLRLVLETDWVIILALDRNIHILGRIVTPPAGVLL